MTFGWEMSEVVCIGISNLTFNNHRFGIAFIQSYKISWFWNCTVILEGKASTLTTLTKVLITNLGSEPL